MFDGGDGNDTLVGYGGDGQLNGQAGTDQPLSGSGNDVLVAIDAGTGDTLTGNAGIDAFWVDRNGSPNGIAGESRVTVTDASSGERVQAVASFANAQTTLTVGGRVVRSQPIDLTLDGDFIENPAVRNGFWYSAFTGNPLFAKSGPSMSDVGQGNLGDCYLLAGLGAIAKDSPMTLRQNIVDFNDGTYGVRLGESFYRVDNDLPVAVGTSAPAFAQLGRERSMWVAVVEKAFAHHRRGQNSYASIEDGMPEETHRAFGATNAGHRTFSRPFSVSYFNGLVAEMYDRWSTKQSVTMTFHDDSWSNGPLEIGHAYTVVSFVRNAVGAITGLVLRNPWGHDGGNLPDSNPHDGLVTLTTQHLMHSNGRMSWGRV